MGIYKIGKYERQTEIKVIIFYPKIICPKSAVCSLLIFIGLAYLTNWDVRYEMLVIFLLTCIISLNVYCLSRLTLRSNFITVLFLLAISNLLIFSPAQYENWLWGIQVVVYIPIACLTGYLVIAKKKLSLRTKLIICF